MRTHLKYTLWLLKWACTWGGVTTLWPRSTYCLAMSMLGNHLEQPKIAGFWRQLGTNVSAFLLAFPALQKWCCGVSNQRRVIKICTNKPGKLHADAEPKFVYFACFSIKPKNNNNSNRRGSSSNNKKNICIKQQTAHRFEGEEVGRPQTEVNESLPGESGWGEWGGWGGSAKENPKIQTPRRRRNHFINASFVREHGAGHGQDIAIRHMRPTWARGECDCPLPLSTPTLSHLPPLLTNGSCLHAGHETLRETCHQGWNNVWQSWKSWLFFARRLRKRG